MHSFTDNQNRAWTLTLNVAAVKRVRDLAHVDLMEALDPKLAEKLASDPVLLCDVLYVLVKPDADARGVSDEDFGRGLAGDAIDRATAALLAELVDFFPLAKRQAVSQCLMLYRRLEELAYQRMAARLSDPEIERQFATWLAGLGAPSPSAPASPQLTPAP